MPVVLGSSPTAMLVKLTLGADFISGFDSEDGNWPGTAVIALHFNDSADTVWTATINGTAVDWNIDKAQVAALVSRFPRSPRAHVTYVDGTTDLMWFEGQVAVDTRAAS